MKMKVKIVTFRHIFQCIVKNIDVILMSLTQNIAGVVTLISE